MCECVNINDKLYYNHIEGLPLLKLDTNDPFVFNVMPVSTLASVSPISWIDWFFIKLNVSNGAGAFFL